LQAIVVAIDPDEREILTFVLRHAGLAVASSGDLQRVLTNWLEHPADVILISLDGHERLVQDVADVRAVTAVPVLVIADLPPEANLCAALLAGADLVLPRPVSGRVLSAYVQILVRRSGALPSFILPRLDLQDVTLDPATRTIEVAGHEPQRLTQLEFRLLFVLMTNRGQVIPTDTIVERVWGYAGAGERDLVRGLVSRLRRKMEPDPDQPRYIETVQGVGYRFIVDEPLSEPPMANPPPSGS
jgi:two-component system KDP operon response regulator KdpE